MNNETYQPQQSLSKSKLEHPWHLRSLKSMKEKTFNTAFMIAYIDIVSFPEFPPFFLVASLH